MSADGTNAMFGVTTSGMPLSHLDYGYIGKCTNPSELEKIVKVLRSGEEGTYPELTTFAEKQLESINPKSKVLRKDIPVQSYRDLDSSERDELTGDFKDWISEINSKDSQLKKNGENSASNTDNLPPVRSSKTVGSTTLDTSQVSSDARCKTKRSVAPRGYQDWDKFNVDEELKTLEQKEDQELKKKKEKAKINSTDPDLPVDVKTSGKSDAELTLLAEREKDKGNEAFRCGDYKESLVYYSRSIQYKPSAASYNNRAFANLRLKQFNQAIDDCNTVLDIEPSNLKAFLRRALAYKGKGDDTRARCDLNKVLEIEPNNKRAQEILNELSADEEKSNNNLKTKAQTKKKGTRMKIIEIDSNEEEAAVKEEKKPAEKADQSSNSPAENADQSSNSPAVKSDQSSNSPAVKCDQSSNSPVGKADQSSNSPADLTDGNCLSSSSTKTKDNYEQSPSKTSQNDEEKPLQSSKSETEHSSYSTSVKKEHSEHKEIVVQSPPPVVELPGIVVRSKDEGMSLYKLGRYAEAAEKFTVAIELLEKDKSQFKSALSSLLNNRAACLQRIGDAFGCIKDCTTSLALLPGSVKPLLKRASSNEMLERYEESYIDFNTVAMMDPSNQTALNGKSRVSKHLVNTYGSSWRERISDTKVAEAPTSSELLNTGTDNTVEKTFNILGNKQSTPVPSRTTNTTIPGTAIPGTAIPGTTNPSTTIPGMPGTRDKEKKNETAVEESAEKKFEKCKEKGNMFVKQGKLDQAIQCYTECIHLDPSKVAVFTNRALCYLKLEKFTLAEDDASKALELQDDNVKALYRRGLARKALQKYEEAAKDLVNLIKIEPTNTSGKKELDIVLNLCREQRKKQKEANNSKSTINEPKPTNTVNETKPKIKAAQNKQTKRRRVQIEEVNGVEDRSSNSPSVSQKPPESASPRATVKNTKINTPAETTQETPKPKTSPSKDQKKKKIKLHKATAFDFYQAWNSVKQKDLSSYADILRQLNPALLPKVLSNKLDADMFRCIIGAISEQLLPSGEDKLSFDILRYLCEAQRFGMVKMFLDSNDNRAINDLYTKLASSRSKSEFVDVDIFNNVLTKYKV